MRTIHKWEMREKGYHDDKMVETHRHKYILPAEMGLYTLLKLTQNNTHTFTNTKEKKIVDDYGLYLKGSSI